MSNQLARALVCALVGALALGGCGTTASQQPSTSSAYARSALAAAAARGKGKSPLSGRSLYVNPANPAALEARRLLAQGNTHDAGLLQRIATRPVGTWFASESPQLEAQVAALANAANARHKLALIVAYYLPQRDCGAGYSSGGAPTPSAYLDWIGRIAAGIGSGRAIVILEPDAVPDIVAGCLNTNAVHERLELLQQAIAALKRDPGVLVYLDAGNAGWIKPSSKLLAPLRAAGLAEADGFALNVANFESTAASIGYGKALSRKLHGAHFVIDTSRNGNGVDRDPADKPTWCNPPGRALGQPPTTRTGVAGVDAFLWIKPPGASDGNCRPGAPPAGQWWAQYALQLAAAAQF